MIRIRKNRWWIIWVIILVVLLVTFLSCDSTYTKSNTEMELEYDIIMVDSCEYIVFEKAFNSSVTITHKGDCKNSIHPYMTYKRQNLRLYMSPLDKK